MNSKHTTSWVVGVIVLAAAYGAWVALIESSRFSDWLMLLVWSGPLVAAFVTSFLAPSRKFILGASMALPAALFSVAVNFLFQAVGRAVDFPGFNGGWILLFVTLSYAGVLSLIGACLGLMLARWRKNEG